MSRDGRRLRYRLRLFRRKLCGGRGVSAVIFVDVHVKAHRLDLLKGLTALIECSNAELLK